jgi:hypothetical protein
MPTRLKKNIATAELKLTDEEIKLINKVSAIPMLYPNWHQERWVKDPFSEADKVLFRRE